MARPTTYWDYIRVEQILSLQSGVAPDESTLSDDEVRFIVIHQIDELWFKLVLRELRTTRDLFKLPHVPETSLASAVASLRRVTTMFDLASRHFQLMETMRTQDYLEFRDKLSPASGFQSAQMRQIEILLGLSDEDRLAFGHEGSYLDALRDPGGGESPAMERVRRAQQDRPTLKDAVGAWLCRTPIQGSSPENRDDARVVHAYVEAFLKGHEESCRRALEEAVRSQALTREDEDRLRDRYREQLHGARRHLQAEDVPEPERAQTRRLRVAILFIDSHRQLPLLSWPGQIIDALVELEQSMLVFRQRHARMVERVIGRRVGTGGSDGVDYLDQTALRYRVFKEIWAARTLLLPAELTPPVENEDFYGLRAT